MDQVFAPTRPLLFTEAPPLTREPKPEWAAVPEVLRAQVRQVLGADVLGVSTVYGGYSPSAAFSLRLTDGREVFCKGGHPGQTELGNAALEAERRVYEGVPQAAALAPKILGHVAGEGWRLYRGEEGWRRLADSEELREGFTTLFDDRAWLERHLEQLLALDAGAAKVGGPRSSLHDQRVGASLGMGFFAGRAFLPEIPALPRLRWKQRAQLFAGAHWLTELMGWEPLPAARAR